MSDRVWTQVTLRVPAAVEDAVSDFLPTLTERGVRIDHQGGKSVIEAYLEPEDREDRLLLLETHLGSLSQMGLLPEGTRAELDRLVEEDWMAVFRSQHTTIRVSERLVVRPTWCEPTGGREVVLDPGLAFGTGSHPTTRMCLTLLDELVVKHTPERMFDLGTGSGILAIAAAHLGVREVHASDIDAVAVKVAADNAAMNGVGDSVSVTEGGVEAARGLYDVVTANISAPLLSRLAGDIARLLKPGGALIISGILVDERDQVMEAYTRLDLTAEKVMKEKVWVAGVLKKRS